MAKVLVTSTGIERTLPAKVDEANIAALTSAGSLILEALKNAAPEKSGDLKRSLVLDSIDFYGKNRYGIKVESDSPYFYAIVYGRGEIVIRPVYKAALRWADPSQPGGYKFSKWAVVPARPPNNFVTETVKDTAQQVTDLVRKELVVRIRR